MRKLALAVAALAAITLAGCSGGKAPVDPAGNGSVAEGQAGN